MKKITTIIFLILVCATLCFGQIIVEQAQHELKDLFYEFNEALRRFCYASTF